ncbi:MAG: type III-B CRISPR module-associated protein Cmr5 [Anaerolineaceae bacterium]|nr:type III-B CRISPR module-associated protein Cmr5 [Anaerolineaceae bacterium]
MHTIQQDMAPKVYDKVQGAQRKDKTERDRYGSMALKLPVLVRQAGLIQAVTFVETRGKAGHKALLEDLAQVVDGKTAADFLRQCREADLGSYMWLTRQTLSALEWFKRFAQSVLDAKPGQEGET